MPIKGGIIHIRIGDIQLMIDHGIGNKIGVLENKICMGHSDITDLTNMTDMIGQPRTTNSPFSIHQNRNFPHQRMEDHYPYTLEGLMDQRRNTPLKSKLGEEGERHMSFNHSKRIREI